MTGLGLKHWSQLRDPDPEFGGRTDDLASSDCGEESAAIQLYGVKGVTVTARWVRLNMPGHETSALTNGPDLARFLVEENVPALAAYPDLMRLKAVVEMQLSHGMGCIVLGTYQSPRILHWVDPDDYGPDWVSYVDPWDGGLHRRDWMWFLSQYRGELVRVLARCQYR